MGNSKSKQPKQKLNKDHKRDKTFRVGLSFGREDLTMEGHLQIGYVSKTKKNYENPKDVPQDEVPLLQAEQNPDDEHS